MKTSFVNTSVRALRVALFGLGLALVVSAASGSALAADHDAPEVDPGSLASVVTLLTGGVLTLTGRIRRGK